MQFKVVKYKAQSLLFNHSYYFNSSLYDQNIIITQPKTQMMNYVSMAPNFYCMAPLPAHSFATNPSFKENKGFANLALLNSISQALRMSLKNYEEHLANIAPATHKTQQESFSNEQKLNNAMKVIEIIISEDQGEEKYHSTNVEQTRRECTKPPTLPQKTANLNVQLSTDDENINEPKIKKECESKRRNKKAMCSNSNNSFEVVVPEVDLIETAYLPHQNFIKDSLSKIREQLLSRRVQDCSDFMKSKRERRQIRMLGN